MFLYGMTCLLLLYVFTRNLVGFHAFFKEKDGRTELTFNPCYTILKQT